MARWNGGYNTGANYSKSYDCNNCASYRISEQLRGLHNRDVIGFKYVPQGERVRLQKKARRQGQPLGIYRYRHVPEVLAITTTVVVPSAYEMSVVDAIDFAVTQGVELRVEGWSRNDYFPVVPKPEHDAEVALFPSHIHRSQQRKIMKALGWRVGKPNPKHDGFPLQYLIEQACIAWDAGRLDDTWTCPTPYVDGTEEWDEDDDVVLGNSWADL